jgi:hypothetical protein
MPLRPAEVHPEEHLRPVGRLGAAGARADREERPAVVVLAGEQELRPLPTEVRLEGRRLALQLGGELRVAGLVDELERGEEVVDPLLEPAPELDLLAEAVGLAKGLLGDPLVIPEVGFRGQRLELGEAALLRPEVKDAPRSTGSARPGRG